VETGFVAAAHGGRRSGVVIGLAALLAAGDRTFWLPEGRSTFASEIDSLFYLIYWVCVFFFLLILGMAVWFLVKYRRRGDEVVVQKSAHHNTLLELVWSGIPLLISLAIFVLGFRGYMDLMTPPDDAYQIQVGAQKWSWTFTYPNGYVDSELHVPAGRPVSLIMSSQDVLHSFFVPELRTKHDVIPGRYTTVWFNADRPFEGTVYCTEYCGTNHSQMQSLFVAHDPAEFHKWLENASRWWEGMEPAEAGALLYQKRGCVQCHSVDGSGGIGPTFRGSFGNRRQFVDGQSAEMDENYIRQSVLEPRARVVAGFDPVMPTFQGRLKDEELAVLIAYIKSLSGS
jgi:cytochrome c oxidase subunit 2